MGQEDLLEKEMATYSSIFVWEIPQTDEPGRLQSIGLQSIHNLVTKLIIVPAHSSHPNGILNQFLELLSALAK